MCCAGHLAAYIDASTEEPRPPLPSTAPAEQTAAPPPTTSTRRTRPSAFRIPTPRFPNAMGHSRFSTPVLGWGEETTAPPPPPLSGKVEVGQADRRLWGVDPGCTMARPTPHDQKKMKKKKIRKHEWTGGKRWLASRCSPAVCHHPHRGARRDAKWNPPPKQKKNLVKERKRRRRVLHTSSPTNAAQDGTPSMDHYYYDHEKEEEEEQQQHALSSSQRSWQSSATTRCGSAVALPVRSNGPSPVDLTATSSSSSSSSPLPLALDVFPTSPPCAPFWLAKGNDDRRAGQCGELLIGPFIAGGACGRVYQCLHLGSHRLLAVKELCYWENDPHLSRRLHQLAIELEVMDLSTTYPSHGIVEFFCVEKRGHTILIFMEYCEGGSLMDYCMAKKGIKPTPMQEKERVVEEKSIQWMEENAEQTASSSEAEEDDDAFCGSPNGLPWGEIQHFTYHMTRALAFLHQHGYAHLDIKTANILVTGTHAERQKKDHPGKKGKTYGASASEGENTTPTASFASSSSLSALEIRLADFGSAARLQKKRSPHGPPHESSYLAVMEEDADGLDPPLRGTPLYMAPEIIRMETEHIGIASDVWSLGCVVMELATGASPWAHLSTDKLRVLFLVGNAVTEALPLPPALAAYRPEGQRRFRCGPMLASWRHHDDDEPPPGAAVQKVPMPPKGNIRVGQRDEEANATAVVASLEKEERARSRDGAGGGSVDTPERTTVPPLHPTLSFSPVESTGEAKTAWQEGSSSDGHEIAQTKRMNAMRRRRKMEMLVDFIAQCTRVRPEDRPSAEGLLQHAFFSGMRDERGA